MYTRVAPTSLCLILMAGLGSAQLPADPRPAFEVATIKPHPVQPGPLRASAGVGPAGIDYVNLTLRACIQNAYGVPRYRLVGGPDWLATERFDISAKASQTAPKSRLMLMLQVLLEQRLRLSVHHESRELPVYALVVDKGGVKLRRGEENGNTEIGGATHLIDSRGISMTALAGALTQFLQTSGRPVIDSTGLAGVGSV